METSFAASLQLGIPRPVQTMFLLEDAMSLLVNDFALAKMRYYLGVVANIEKKLADSVNKLEVEKVGNITMRGAKRGETGPDLLEREYIRWVKRIADMLGVPPYPYSSKFQSAGGARMISVTRR